MSVPQSPVEYFQVVDAGKGDHPTGPESDTHGLKVIVNYTSSNPNTPIRVHLNEDQVLEVLISICRELKIPLPRRGQKFLAKHKDGLAMTIGMTENELRVVKVTD